MPNVHPLIVHFPIALFLTGVGVDALGWLLKQASLKWAGLVMVLLGALLAVPALATGLAIEETIEAQIEHIPGAEEALEAHEEVAIPTTATLLGAALLRLGLAVRPRLRALLGLYAAVALVGAGLLVITGYRGGELVYTYGAGVQVVQPASPPEPAADND